MGPLGPLGLEGPSHSSKAASTRQGKSPLKWTVPTYRGLVLGKTDKVQVERILGRPMWSGTPEEAVFEKNRDRELWYEYDGADGSSGRTTVAMNHTGVVVTVLVYPKKAISLSRVLQLYGSCYLERRWSPCLTEHELSQIPEKDRRRPLLDTFLVYPERGMYLHRGEPDGDIWEIGYLLQCP